MSDIAERIQSNPILRPSDIKPSIKGMRIECLLNPGVFQFKGKTWLLLRVAEMPVQKKGKTSLPVFDENGKVKILTFSNSDPRLDLSDPRVISYNGDDYLTTMSHLRLVASEDGVNFSEEPGYPVLFGDGEQESFGIEDCRVVLIEGVYYLTYTAVSRHGVGVGLRSTRNWRSFKKHGVIFPAHNKDCAIFAEKIGGKYYAFHRPSSPELGGNYIWIAESTDLEHWGNHRCILHSRPGMWDSARVGAGAAPIRTKSGWLEIYHGADEKNRYCLGAVLLDLKRPWKVLARSREPIMEPTAGYEKTGFFGNVIFTNGHTVNGNGDMTVYYGASDSVICCAKFCIKDMMKAIR